MQETQRQSDVILRQEAFDHVEFVGWSELQPDERHILSAALKNQPADL